MRPSVEYLRTLELDPAPLLSLRSEFMRQGWAALLHSAQPEITGGGADPHGRLAHINNGVMRQVAKAAGHGC